MPRYILIDSISGHVFADSADFAGGAKFNSPMQFAKAFDASTQELGRKYEWLREAPAEGGLGYHVYRPPPSLDLPIVEDGTTAEELAAIKRDSTYVGFVRCLRQTAGRGGLEPASGKGPVACGPEQAHFV